MTSSPVSRGRRGRERLLPNDENSRSQQERFTGNKDHLRILLQEVKAWNKWREENPKVQPDLGGANLAEENLEEARLWGANLERVVFCQSNLRGAQFFQATLMEAKFIGVNLESADFTSANLEGALFGQTNLQGAGFHRANLKGVEILRANLRGTRLRSAVVDGYTLIEECNLDRATDFTSVGLANVRMFPPGDRAYLERNIREISWRKWNDGKPRLVRWGVQFFWYLSDYGASTKRLLLWFFIFAAFFAGLYALPFEFVTDIRKAEVASRSVEVPTWIVPIRAVYFSVVTMTTLGFGDIHAHPASALGHLLLTVQVLLGYFLLGALITRLAILFQSPGAPSDHGGGGAEKRIQEVREVVDRSGGR